MRHSGGFVGFRADIVRYPSEEFTVICLANLGSINPSGLCNKVADIYLADQFEKDASPETAADPAGALDPVELPGSALENKVASWLHEASGMTAETSLQDDRLVSHCQRPRRHTLAYPGGTIALCQRLRQAVPVPYVRTG